MQWDGTPAPSIQLVLAVSMPPRSALLGRHERTLSHLRLRKGGILFLATLTLLS